MKKLPLTLSNISESIDDDALAPFHLDDLGRAVRHTAVIDEPSYATLLGCIDDRVVIDPEEVAAADAALKISMLSEICNLLPHFLADILDNHVVLGDVLHGV